MARPTKYKRQYCEELITFFSVEPTIESTRTIISKRGTVVEKYDKPSLLPTFEAFANKIGIETKTLYNWAEVHPEFLLSMTRARQIQFVILLNNGLLNHYNANLVALAAKNLHNWRDKQEVEHSVDGNIMSLVAKVCGKDG